MEYICENPNCSEYKKTEFFSSERYIFRNGEFVGEHAICPCCRKERECVDDNAKIPLSEKHTGIMLFNSKSKDEKREILRKRSHEHFQKEIKERKDGLMNKAMSEMKNLGK